MLSVIAITDCVQLVCAWLYLSLQYVYPYTGSMKGYYEDVWPFMYVLSLPIWYWAQFITVYLLVALTFVLSLSANAEPPPPPPPPPPPSPAPPLPPSLPLPNDINDPTAILLPLTMWVVEVTPHPPRLRDVLLYRKAVPEP